ncbi:MAG: class I SAM-dependent methyltransferase [Acidobacteriota bacterium]
MTNELYYDSIADHFESWTNDFDLRTRLEWFSDRIDEFDMDHALVLDVGSGLGHFSRLVERKQGRCISLDIAGRMLSRSGVPRPVQASALRLPFSDGSLQVVVSSECIEHTPDPTRAIRDMVRVLRPGGVLILSCPNHAWRWSVPVARGLGLRKFSGPENWPRLGEVRQALEESGAEVVLEQGLYLLPFQLSPLKPLISWLNRHAQRLRSLMINQCWVVRRR